MSVVSDLLETVLKLTGGPQYAQGLDSAAKKLDNLAKAEVAQEKAAATQARAMQGGLTSLAMSAAGSLAAAFAIREFVQAAEAQEDATFRTTVLLRNLGNSYPIERAQAFAEGLAQSTSASRAQIVGLIGLEKQFGVADNQVEGLSKTLLDFAKGNAKGLDLESVSNAALKAINGNPMLLKRMGIQFKDTGDKARNTIELMTTLNNLFGGAAEAARNTLSGAMDHLAASWQNFASSVTGFIPVINLLASALDKVAGHPSLSTGAAGAALGFGIGRFFGPQGALIGTAIGGIGGAIAGALAPHGNAAANIGNGKDKLATESTLAQIEANTAKTAEAFVKGVLGGPGTIARGAMTARDAKLAFGV